MAADTASGGLDQLEQHYDTFIVSIIRFCLHSRPDIASTDGTRHCPDCRGRFELDPTSDSLLGYRNLAWRAFLGEDELEVRPCLIYCASWLILYSRYILRILSWCRKYGLRVNLDLHTIPGSQNGV